MHVRLHVDEVIVHGVAVHDVPRFRAAFEAELAALVVRPEVAARLAAQSGSVASLAAPAPAASATPEETGRHCARAVLGALG
jgi:hypothetical protein